MSTSAFTTLFKATGSDKISLGTLGYIRARNRQRAYSLIVGLFKKSGLTQVELAKRLGRGTDVISRLLSRPGNWELDTFSDLLFGISGSLASFGAPQPLTSAAIMRRKTESIGSGNIMTLRHNKPSFQSQPTATSPNANVKRTESVQLVLSKGNSNDVVDAAVFGAAA
ncbi:MAG TPA: hypothetical protein VGG01_12305 [Xanthobacteraceae bacterium]